MRFFQSYNNYKDDIKLDPEKIQWIKPEEVKFRNKSEKLLKLQNEAINEFFDMYLIADQFFMQTLLKPMSKTRPTLKYGESSPKIFMLLNRYDIPYKSIYNKVEDIEKSANKKIWHKTLGNQDFIPKTVYSKEDALNLKFPIVAKPAKGHSGLGIKYFKDKTSFEIDSSVFDIYSEAVNISREFRALFVRGKLYMIIERLTNTKYNRDITNKDKEDDIPYVYVEQDLEKSPIDEIYNIDSIFRKYIPVDFYSLDLILDTDNKLWLIESNAGTGLGANMIARSYESIYKNFHGRQILDSKRVEVERICSEFQSEIKQLYPLEYNNSIAPKIY